MSRRPCVDSGEGRDARMVCLRAAIGVVDDEGCERTRSGRGGEVEKRIIRFVVSAGGRVEVRGGGGGGRGGDVMLAMGREECEGCGGGWVNVGLLGPERGWEQCLTFVLEFC